MAGWDEYLLAHSGLPGPRGNIELAQVVADEGSLENFEHYLSFTPERAPVNSPEEFLAFCGAVGLGRLLAEGHTQYLARLRELASNPRWRMREGVAMALQRWGDVDMPALLDAMPDWSRGSWLEQRAAAAALCEPRLLKRAEDARRVLALLDWITAAIESAQDRKNEDFKVLRQGMAYCWSVAVAALPAEGMQCMDLWLASIDKDVRWILQENFKKNRLIRMNPSWVAECQKRLEDHADSGAIFTVPF